MVRQRFSILAAIFLFAAALGAMTLSPAPIKAQRTPPGRVSTCVGEITSTARISPVDPCAYEVKVNFEPQCPVCAGGINIVFVQMSELFQPNWQNDTAATALQVVEKVARSNRSIKVKGAVVHYNRTTVRVAAQMTENLASVKGALRQPIYGHDPVTDVEGAARAATRQLDLAHRDDPERIPDDERCDVVIFYASTKSIYTEMRARMQNAANEIKRKRVSLLVGCPEQPEDYCVFTKEMSNEYTKFPEGGRMRSMTEDHMQDYTDTSGMMLRWLNMVQLIPPGLTYVEGSASIPPTDMKQVDGKFQMSWGWERLRELQPISVTYSVKPDPGVGAVYQLDGQLKIVDGENKVRDVVMASQAITVPEGICLPVPTPTNTNTPVPPTETPVFSPTPTPTNTPVDTATPTPTNTPVPTATNTPTPLPKPIYIPIIIGEVCFQQWVHGDVVLVIDTSTSMNRASRAGLTKMAAAIGAAQDFVKMMDFAPDRQGHHDQVAVVGFNDRAWIQSGLTSSADQALAALADLPKGQAEGTRLDLAFQRGLEAASGAGKIEGNTPVMIFLTDGLPNRVPAAEDGHVETTVRRAAQAAKDYGMRVYTIGVGAQSDINSVLMRECSTSDAHFYYAPEPEDLDAIYRQIAFSIGCPPDDFWGRR